MPKGAWTTELPHVLWSHRTTHKIATCETPFTLTYGSEAVAPEEMNLPSLRVQTYNPKDNHRKLLEQLDMVESRRDAALERIISEKVKVAASYNKKVRSLPLEEGDTVLKCDFQKRNEHGKLAATWEGPFLIGKKTVPSTFRLATMEGIPVSKTWNDMHLRRYYSDAV
ncbi:unnamed protein product [Linum trigynum]|uniref:Reverse transcriptase domain-containing protein n=1 Tax=Linum trigynum TaxID=586398 RepID=A0AAV2CXY9_9ROSI